MLKVGITGGIGSGKSIVGEIFKVLGIPVYNADEEAKKLINSDPDIIKQFTNRYGDDIYADGKLNRKKLSSLIFNNSSELEFVNATVHPRVFAHFDEWLELNNDSKYIIKEAALLFETGSYRQLDKIILVTAPEELRMKRVVKRDKTTKEAVEKIMQSQMKEDEKSSKSDFIIYNDEKNLLIPQVLKLHSIFINSPL